MGSPGRRPFWLAKMEENTPEVIRRMELGILMRLTAASFGCKPPSMRKMDSKKRLETYRRFTAEIIGRCSKKALPFFRKNMYRRAFCIGRCLSLLPGLGTWGNKKRLIVVLYRNIGIEVRDGADGTDGRNNGLWHICIPHCSFSLAYSPQTCYVMSGLDAGIICGIFGGGSLQFTQRITEGCPYCGAVYRK